MNTTAGKNCLTTFISFHFKGYKFRTIFTSSKMNTTTGKNCLITFRHLDGRTLKKIEKLPDNLVKQNKDHHRNVLLKSLNDHIHFYFVSVFLPQTPKLEHLVRQNNQHIKALSMAFIEQCHSHMHHISSLDVRLSMETKPATSHFYH